MSVRRRPLGLSAIVATCLAGVVLFSGTAASADVTYIYDELDRLVRVIRDTGEAATYQYDAVGNLLGITRATGVPSNTTVTSASSSNLLRGSCPTLTIIGFNFLGAVVTASSGITITSTQVQLDSLVVQVCVDAGATLGPGSITIQNDYGTATAPVAVWNPLVVTGISPTKAASGMVVTLTGSPFDPTAANNTVKVNGTPATVLTSTSTVLTFRVPAGATTGPVDVTTPTAYGPGAATLTVQTLGAARSQVPTADLLAYWSFDVDGRDNADSLDVTLQGGLTNGAGGILGAALDFPADPGRMASSNSSIFNFGAADFTAALWIRWTSTAGEQVMLDTCDNGCGSAGWTLSKLSATDSRGAHALLAYPLVQSGANTFVPGQWYHIALVRQGSTASLYVNGVQIAQATGVGTIPSAQNPFLIGRRNGSQLLPVSGAIDEVGVWARALTSGEISALATPPPPGPPFIASLTPSRAIPGMQVTVQGSGFDQGTPPNNVVKINGVQAQVLQTTPAALTVRVPTGATTGPVTVTAPLGTGTSAQNLVIRSLGPNRTNVPTTDLLAYWTFDVDGSDGAGSWDLTLEGGLSLTTAGRIGSALNFPGNGNMVAARLQNDPVFNFGASDVSFALWVNWASVSGEQVMLDKCDSGCAAGGWTFTKLSPTDSRGGNALLAYPIVQSGANSLVTGQWYHVAVVRQGSTAQLYLNGVQIAQATGVGTIPTAMSPFLVGGRSGSQVLPMNGVIDEVGIWARALTAAEVAALATPP